MSRTPNPYIRIAVAAASAAAFAACAHTPPPPAPVASTPPPPPYTVPPPPPPPAYAGNGQIGQGPLPGSEQDFVINAGDRVYFDFDQYTIRGDGQGVLARQAGWLSRYPGRTVRIEGNCDERGTREYNFALGARRADAVKRFLVEHGVEAGRISTISYGKERPTDTGTGEDAWAHDRNAHTALTSGPGAVASEEQ